MKSFDTDIKKYTNKVRLKASERNALRARILTYMEYHPLPKQSVHEAVESIESQSFVTVQLNAFYARMTAGTIAVLMIIGVPFAAERAVPGDVLYPIKTQVNEGIRHQLANSPYERVVLETQLLERRIAEARLLASEGKLTEAVEASIAAEVKEHADAAQEGIVALRAEDIDEAAIAEVVFDSALVVQSAVLEGEVEKSASSSVTELAVVVRETHADVRAQKGTTTPSHAGVLARIERETTRAYELFASIEDTVTADEHADIERRLADVERTIVAAQDAETEDVDGLIDSLGLIQKLIAFMTDIDVSQHVALETLVPMVLTDAERAEAVTDTLNDVAVHVAEVTARLPHVDAAMAAKVTLGLDTLDAYSASTTAALTAGDIATAEQTVARAEEIALDMARLTSAAVVPTAGTAEEEVPSETVLVSEDDQEPEAEAEAPVATSTPAEAVSEPVPQSEDDTPDTHTGDSDTPDAPQSEPAADGADINTETEAAAPTDQHEEVDTTTNP